MRPNEAPQPDPLGYLLTWSTYGAWLPGDERGWTKEWSGPQPPNRLLERDARRRMGERCVKLNPAQREVVEKTIRAHCEIRGWELFAVNCRTNHVHVVVAAPRHPDEVQRQFKAWCARKLSEQEPASGAAAGAKRTWWGEGGSGRYLNDERSLEAAILYVRDAQDERPDWK
jgi:REP element-mobilizing transposase RayT